MHLRTTIYKIFAFLGLALFPLFSYADTEVSVSVSPEGPFGISDIQGDQSITVSFSYYGLSGTSDYAITLQSVSSLGDVETALEEGQITGQAGNSDLIELSDILLLSDIDPKTSKSEHNISIYVIIEYDTFQGGYYFDAGSSGQRTTVKGYQKIEVDLKRPNPPKITKITAGENQLHVVISTAKASETTTYKLAPTAGGEDTNGDTGDETDGDEPTDSADDADVEDASDDGADGDAGDNANESQSDYLDSDVEKFFVYYRKVDENGEPLESYKKYDKSSITGEITIEGLQNYTTYEIAARALDDAGNLSDYSEPMLGTPRPVDDFYEYYRKAGGKETGGYCFIATAAFDAGDIALYKFYSFRDRVLARIPLGRAIIKLYYAASPPIAETIQQNPVLKLATRVMLYPISWVAFSLVKIPASGSLYLLLGLLFALSGFRRRRGLQ
ncbi:MAG: hypothetical protein Kow0090_05100 [Myxococcota bacterium]